MGRRFTALILASMFAGIAVGFACNKLIDDPAQTAAVADWLSVVTDIFLRLIKMIIAPLVFSTLVVGVAHLEDAGTIGRVGAKTMVWFVGASVVSLLLGLAMVHLLEPGVGLALPASAIDGGTSEAVGRMDVREVITHIVPQSIAEAMAENEILQIVVFSIFIGAAVASLGKKVPVVLALAEQVAAVMLAVTRYVMVAAPLAVFAALAATVTSQGLGILAAYAKFVGGFYLSLAILWGVLLCSVLAIVGRKAGPLIAVVRQPVLLAFSTASSEAAYPQTLEQLEAFGVPRRIGSFVLSLGYSFNLDGSMMYCTFAVLFIAQAYGIELSLEQQAVMLLLLMITSKGMGGVPRASLVVIAATLSQFNIPQAGLLLILAVDHLLDMGRSATNVVGNAVASVVVACWERQFPQSKWSAEPIMSGVAATAGVSLEDAAHMQLDRHFHR